METQFFLNHLLELRKRLIHSLIALLIITCSLFPFSASLFHYLAIPLLHQLPQGQNLIAINIVSPLLIPLKLVLILGLLVTFPYFIFQFWTFVAPALYNKEKKILWVVIIMSTLLFYCGMLFTYFVVFPLMFQFFIAWVPQGVTAMPDISQYLDFSIKLFAAFGIAFEIPIAVLLLINTHLVSLEKLIEIRPYVIVGSFVLGMLFMPPDVISQSLFAVPMCILYQVGLWLGYYTSRK